MLIHNIYALQRQHPRQKGCCFCYKHLEPYCKKISPTFYSTYYSDTIFLILLLFLSSTYTVPFLSTATPVGALKAAASPMASAYPAIPLPAKVLTSQVPALIYRIAWSAL